MASPRARRIAVIPGDGIGKEVIPAALQVIEAAAKGAGAPLECDRFDWSCDYYLQHGRMMPEDGLSTLRGYDAIYFGAVGWPARVPDHVSVWGLLMPLRKSFDQYVNLRPCELLPGVRGPLRDKGPSDVDFVCVRENSEGEYTSAGGRVHPGSPQEVAVHTSIFSRFGIERVVRYAFDLARERQKTGAKLRARAARVTAASKSNALNHTMGLWDEVFREAAKAYPDVEAEVSYVDSLSARMVTHPETLDVVVASNLFGDILTDLGGALVGSLGMGASANVNPERRFPSLFEPVHGSAPDIFGKGIANPIATVSAGALMLDHLGAHGAAANVRAAVRSVTREGKFLTPDLGGKATTVEAAEALRKALAPA